MKKITQLTTALVLTASCWTVQATAQDLFVQDKALKADQITAGKTVAFKGISETNTEWVNWSGPSTTVASNNGIFTVEDSNGGIVLKRKADGKYLGRSGDAIQFVDEASSAAVLTVSCPALDGTEVSGTHEVSLPTWAVDQGYQVRFTNNGNFLNVQSAQTSPKGTPKFAPGKGSWSVVMVYDAENYEAPCVVTVKKTDTKGNVLGTETMNINPGDEYSIAAPAVNYYTYTGTVKVNNVESNESSIVINENTTIEYVYEWNLPFETTVVSGNEFPADTKWYLVRLRDQYISYNNSTPDEIPSTPGKTYDDGYWWAFGSDENGNIKVYNKAAGAGQIMTSASPDDAPSSTYVHFENAAEMDESKNEAWTIYPSKNYAENGFYLARAGESTYKIKLQNNKLVYWNGQDIGSTFRVASIADEVKALENSYTEANKRGAVGGLTTEGEIYFATELAKGTPEGLLAASQISDKENYIINFNPSLYYRIENLMRKYSTRNGNDLNNGGYLEPLDLLETPFFLENNGYFSNDRSASRAQAIWKFVSNGTDGQYYLYSPNAGTYMSGKDGAYFTPGIAETENATAFALEALGSAQYNIKKAGSGQRLHASGAAKEDGAAVMFYNDGGLNSPSAWYLIPATSIDVTISDAGYATVNYPFAVQVADGVTAYIGTANAEDGVFTLKKIEDGIIPANTPVVLEGAADTYTLSILADNTDAPITGNDLSGSTVFKAVDATANAYILGKGDNGIGFYQMSADDRTLGSNKAYLELPASMSHIRSITIGGPTTGIEDTVAEGAEAEEYYDLQGRRVLNPTKGIYVTKSGKKVLFNK